MVMKDLEYPSSATSMIANHGRENIAQTKIDQQNIRKQLVETLLADSESEDSVYVEPQQQNSSNSSLVLALSDAESEDAVAVNSKQQDTSAAPAIMSSNSIPSEVFTSVEPLNESVVDPIAPVIQAPSEPTAPDIEALSDATDPDIEAPSDVTNPNFGVTSDATDPDIEVPNDATGPDVEVPSDTTDPVIQEPNEPVTLISDSSLEPTSIIEAPSETPASNIAGIAVVKSKCDTTGGNKSGEIDLGGTAKSVGFSIEDIETKRTLLELKDTKELFQELILPISAVLSFDDAITTLDNNSMAEVNTNSNTKLEESGINDEVSSVSKPCDKVAENEKSTVECHSDVKTENNSVTDTSGLIIKVDSAVDKLSRTEVNDIQNFNCASNNYLVDLVNLNDDVVIVKEVVKVDVGNSAVEVAVEEAEKLEVSKASNVNNNLEKNSDVFEIVQEANTVSKSDNLKQISGEEVLISNKDNLVTSDEVGQADQLLQDGDLGIEGKILAVISNEDDLVKNNLNEDEVQIFKKKDVVTEEVKELAIVSITASVVEEKLKLTMITNVVNTEDKELIMISKRDHLVERNGKDKEVNTSEVEDVVEISDMEENNILEGAVSKVDKTLEINEDKLGKENFVETDDTTVEIDPDKIASDERSKSMAKETKELESENKEIDDLDESSSDIRDNKSLADRIRAKESEALFQNAVSKISSESRSALADDKHQINGLSTSSEDDEDDSNIEERAFSIDAEGSTTKSTRKRTINDANNVATKISKLVVINGNGKSEPENGVTRLGTRKRSSLVNTPDDEKKACMRSTENTNGTNKVSNTSSSMPLTNLDKAIQRVAEGNLNKREREISDLIRDLDCKKLKNLTVDDVEAMVSHKLCDIVTEQSEVGHLRETIATLQASVEKWRNISRGMEKQIKDLEMVFKRLVSDTKNNPNVRPVPMKLTRSVGLQVSQSSLTTPKKTVTKPDASSQVKRSPGLITNRNTSPVVSPLATSVSVPVAVPTPIKNMPMFRAPSSQGGVLPVRSSTTQQSVVSRTAMVPVQNPPLGLRLAHPTQVRTLQVMRPSLNPSGSDFLIDLTEEEDKTKTVTKNGVPQTVRLINQSGQGIRVIPQNQLTTNGGIAPRVTLIGLPGAQGKPRSVFFTTSPTQQPVAGDRLGYGRAHATVAPTILLSSGAITTTANTLNQGTMIRMPIVRRLTSVNPNMQIIDPSAVIPISARQHPAPLPPVPSYFPSISPHWKLPPPQPDVKISKTDSKQRAGIVLSWKMDLYSIELHESISTYQLYAYQETDTEPSTTMWKKVGDVKSMPLPMACTLTQFSEGHKYHFAVRALDVRGRIGPFSVPGDILLTFTDT